MVMVVVGNLYCCLVFRRRVPSVPVNKKKGGGVRLGCLQTSKSVTAAAIANHA